MRFYLGKDMGIKISYYRLCTPRLMDLPAAGPVQDSFRLDKRISCLIPMMSEKANGQGYWNMKTVDECARLLMDELIKSAWNSDRLAANITLSCAPEEGKLLFSVAIEDCYMLSNLVAICGENIKLILELRFEDVSNGEGASLPGLVTPEMKITRENRENGKFSCKASDVPATAIMGEFWWDTMATNFGVSALCNIMLVVNDNLTLFQTSRSYDTTRRILEEAIHSDFEIVSSDNAVVKCHRSFLAVHSHVLERMLESGLAESFSNRMKVEDMDKSVVVAFLQFLYCKDLPVGDLSMIFRLLKVAHKYEIDELEQATMRVLIEKEEVHFTPEFTCEVYRFVSKIPNGRELDEKVLEMIVRNPELYSASFALPTNHGSALDRMN